MIEYLLSVFILICLSWVWAQSYNLSFGLTGLFNLGHIVFYGVGAYTAAILNTKYGFDFLINIPIAMVISGLVAGVFGLVTLRLSGHYLAIATLGAAMIASVVATNWVDLTRGPLGIRGIENPIIFGVEFSESWMIALLYLGIAIVVNVLLWKIFHSPFGRLQRAIKDDEIAAKSLGKNTFEAKTWSLIISAAFAAVAGVMYTHYRLFLDPTIFALHEIIFMILALVVGGRGNFWGAILGVVLVYIVGEVPRFVGFPDSIVGAARNILFSALLIVTMFYKPDGLFTMFSKDKKS